MAISLWRAMEDTWRLPDLASIVNSGADWLLQLLAEKTEMECARILMLLWRIWHVRNEVTHFKPAPPVEVSCRFLCSYLDSIVQIKYFPQADCIKGKTPVDQVTHGWRKGKGRIVEERPRQRWTRPPTGWVKLNVDGSSDAESRTGGAGMILRDDNGEIIFSACRSLNSCSSPLESELAACMEGIALVQQRNGLSLVIEMDCLEAVAMIRCEMEDRSASMFILREIKHLLQCVSEFKIEHIKREQNLVSHVLANKGRVEAMTNLWLCSGPVDIHELCIKNCTLVP
jgi:ribonuclease HI